MQKLQDFAKRDENPGLAGIVLLKEQTARNALVVSEVKTAVGPAPHLLEKWPLFLPRLGNFTIFPMA